MNKILANVHEFYFDPSIGLESQSINGFSNEVIECVLDFLHAKKERQPEFLVKSHIAMDVLRLAKLLNIK